MSFFHTTVHYLYYTDIYACRDTLKQWTPIRFKYTGPVVCYLIWKPFMKYKAQPVLHRVKILTDTNQEGHS